MNEYIERRERYSYLKKDGETVFAIRRFAALQPLIPGAAYGTEMVERRTLEDRRLKDKRTSLIPGRLD